MAIINQHWIIRAELCCMLTIWLSCLGPVTTEEDRSIDFQGEFVASNAVRLSVCLTQTHPRPEIQGLSYTMTREGIPLKFESVHLESEKSKKMCQIDTLWFEPEPQDDRLVIQASFTLSNASRTSTVKRTKVVTLTRTNTAPRIPKVTMVRIRIDQPSYDYDYSEEMEIAGPAYNNTVSKTIPYFNDGDISDSFTMECVVEGTSDDNVKWYKNGEEIEQDKLIVTTDPGIYWCGASTEFGTAFSHHIELKIASVHTFSSSAQEPQQVTVNKGNGVKLKCDPLPYCYPDCVVVWKKVQNLDDQYPVYTTLQIDNVKTFTTEDGSLVIKKTEETDNIYYRCDLSNERLGRAVHGYVTKLNIGNKQRSHDIALLHRPKPEVHAREGMPVSLYCIFGGEDTEVQWFRNSNLVETSSILKFDSISLRDAGTYTCSPTDGYGEIYNTNVRVEAQPMINGGRNMNTVYAVANRNATILCNSTGTPPVQISISLAKKNGQHSVQKPVHGGVAMEITKVQDTGIFYCNASNMLGYSFAAGFLRVVEPVKVLDIVDRGRANTKSGFSSLAQHKYICVVTTDPGNRLRIVWRKDGEVLKSNPKAGVTVRENQLELDTNAGSEFHGWYTCEASDGVSSDKKGFSITSLGGRTASSINQPPTATHPNIYLYIVLCGIVGLVVIVVAITIVVGITVKCRSKASPYMNHPRSRLSTMSDGTVGIPNGETDPMFSSATIIRNFHQDQGGHLPVKDPSLRNTVYEVYIDRSRIEMNELIGKGQFGRVYLAQLRSEKATEGRKVAVKTLKYKADETEIVECFLKEAVIMKNFTNPHVLSLIGISFETDGSPMVVLPYMANGDLRDFIQDPDRDITVLELLKLGLQVGKGMSYLALQKYVHRDLACRNCMVAESSTVKVADFGLSRDLFSRDYYREASGKRPLPVRWMAPECHHSNVFTSQTDVWSFGVLLWELMTRGAVPYPNIENWNVSAHVVAGNILPQPNYCPNSVYKIMLSCWNTKAEARTPFAELVHDMEDIIHSANEGQEDCQSLYLNIQRCEELDYRSTSTV